MPLLSFPNELLYLIAEDLEYLRDLYSFLLVNSRLAYILVPLLRKRALDDVDQMSALQWAAGKGHESLVRILLEKGVDVNELVENTPNNKEQKPRACLKDRTALYRASAAGNEAVAKLLLEHGASVDLTGHHKCTPLHGASNYGHERIVRLLLDYGADIEAANNLGWGDRPLSLAVRSSSDAVARVLLERGADASFRTPHGGETLLHLAATEGTSEAVVDMLLEKGVCINDIDMTGRTALSKAALTGNVPLVDALLRRGSDVHTSDIAGQTALYHAATQGTYGAGGVCIGIVRKLLEGGADVANTRNAQRTVIEDVRDDREMRKLLLRGVALRRWESGRIMFLG